MKDTVLKETGVARPRTCLVKLTSQGEADNEKLTNRAYG